MKRDESMTKKKLTAFENIRLVGVHKEPTFGPLPGEPKCKPSYAELQAELNAVIERIRKMSKGDLGPESILSGYAVLVKSLMKRKNTLIAELDKAKEENKRLREELKSKEIAHHHY